MGVFHILDLKQGPKVTVTRNLTPCEKTSEMDLSENNRALSSLKNITLGKKHAPNCPLIYSLS